MTERIRATGAGASVVVLALVLASCAVGVTGPVEDITGEGARLTGTVHNTVAGPTGYWFEYGRIGGPSTSTAHRVADVINTSEGRDVTESVAGLVAGSSYRVRVCARDADGHGICGSDRTFITAGARDALTGEGSVVIFPDGVHRVGASLDVHADPDGSNAGGEAVAAPGSFPSEGLLFDSGPVTCFRIDGNRATVGFAALPPSTEPVGTQPISRLVFVEDNGLTGDRFGSRTPGGATTTCPAATEADFPDIQVGRFTFPPILTSGDFVLHDEPSPSPG